MFTFTQQAICNTVSRTAYAGPDMYRGIRPLCLASGLHKHSECKLQYKHPQEKAATINQRCQLHLYQQSRRASGYPAGATADLRATTEIKMSKRCLVHRLTGENERKASSSYNSLCADPTSGPERLIYNPAFVHGTMLILTCIWMWLSYYQEASLKRRWEAPEF